MTKKTLVSAAVLALLTSLAQAAPLEINGWQVSGNTAVSDADLLLAASGDNQDGKQLAEALIAEYHRNGYLTVEASVDASAKVVVLREVGAAPTGVFAQYLPSQTAMLTADEINLAGQRMAMASSLSGELVNIEILPSDPQTGRAEIRTSTKPNPNAKRYGGNVGLSTSGQRYSGPNIVSAYGFANIGSAQQIDVSLQHGLAHTDESEGGKYESAAVSYRKATRWGLTSVQFANTDYKIGGSLEMLDLTGNVKRVSLEHSYLLSQAVTLNGRLSHVKNSQDFGLLGWTDSQSYTTAFAGARYQAETWSVDGGVVQGLGGKQDFNFTPLLGSFDKHFSAMTLNGTKQFALGAKGWVATAKGGLQVGSKGTPSSEQFSLGGPDRGRSYNTGYVSTPKGAYASLTFTAPVYAGMQAYGGVDGATGSPVVGPDRHASSAFVGVRFAWKSLTGDVGFARRLGSADGLDQAKEKLNVSLTASF